MPSEWYKKPQKSDFPDTEEGKAAYGRALNEFWEKQNTRAAKYGFGSAGQPRARRVPKVKRDRSGPGKGN